MTPVLTIDLDAIATNWRGLAADAGAGVETGAVVKADAYGLGAARVGPALAAAGVRTFFVALAEEGVALRAALGPGPAIHVFSGYMAGDRGAMAGAQLSPLLNSPDQLRRFGAELPGHPCGVQIDTGMNRLGFEAGELAVSLADLRDARPRLAISHLACADDPGDPMNALQLSAFRALTEALPGVRRSLAATGGCLLGAPYRFDLTRPGIGLYGGLPHAGARAVVALSLPVIQVRDVAAGEVVGYGGAWRAPAPSRIATVAAGYADGLPRALHNLSLWAGDMACPVVGRISMDLVTVDVTALPGVPPMLDLLGPHQGIDAVAAAAGTIGYEILTSLGSRYTRVYKGGGAG